MTTPPSAAPDPEEAAVLVEHLRFQADACDALGSPLYANLLERASADVVVGGPVWAALRGYEGDPGSSALALRLMGAVHRLVLEGKAPELAARYRDRAPDPAGAWDAFTSAIEENLEAVRRGVDRPVQTNEVGRCAALLPGFLAVAAGTGLPLRLLEVGASAGLNLRWDRYRYVGGGFAWGPESSPLRIVFELIGDLSALAQVEATVIERSGCDAQPVNLETDEGRITLLSYLWADQVNRRERMLAAFEIAKQVAAPIERASASTWVAERLAAPREGMATVVYHSIVMQYLAEPERIAFEAAIEEAGAGATLAAPLAWLRMEPAGDRAEVWLTSWPGREERLVARAGYHGNPVELGGL